MPPPPMPAMITRSRLRPGEGSTDDGAADAASTADRDGGDSQRRCSPLSDHGDPCRCAGARLAAEGTGRP